METTQKLIHTQRVLNVAPLFFVIYSAVRGLGFIARFNSPECQEATRNIHVVSFLRDYKPPRAPIPYVEQDVFKPMRHPPVIALQCTVGCNIEYITYIQRIPTLITNYLREENARKTE